MHPADPDLRCSRPTALVRVRAKRPSSFLRTAVDSIHLATDNLAAAGAFHHQQQPSAAVPSSMHWPAEVLTAVARFATSIYEDEWVAKERDKVRSVLALLSS